MLNSNGGLKNGCKTVLINSDRLKSCVFKESVKNNVRLDTSEENDSKKAPECCTNTHTHAVAQKAGPQTESHGTSLFVSSQLISTHCEYASCCVSRYWLRRSADPSRRWPIEPAGQVVKKSRLTEGETTGCRKPKCVAEIETTRSEINCNFQVNLSISPPSTNIRCKNEKCCSINGSSWEILRDMCHV